MPRLSPSPWLVQSLLGLILLGTQACDSGSPSAGPEPELRTLTVLYTNDEHGWIQQSEETDGAARLMGLWRAREGYEETGGFLILSGGDNWTGPAISTWFQGESTVAVMNAMDYRASAIGNHEFDFTVEGFRERVSQADFPYLAANIRRKGSGEVPDFIQPFALETVDGIRVALVGLSTTSTPYTTFPTHVVDYEFLPYASSLEEWVPRAWAAGADVVMVLGHICYDEMLSVLPVARQLGVSVLTGGHCNELVGEVREGVALVVGGWRLGHYGKVTLTLDPTTGNVTVLASTTVRNAGGEPDTEIESLVSAWERAVDAELSDVVGFVTESVLNGSPSLYNLVTDSWLHTDPTADIVMTNSGGIRQGIPAGTISLGTVVGVLPFQNSLVRLELTGEEVVECLKATTILAGMSTTRGYLHSDGSPLKMDSLYTVLTTDYLYARDDYEYHLYDPTPHYTGIVYYEPLVRYLEDLNTSPGDPLDRFLDPVTRR